MEQKAHTLKTKLGPTNTYDGLDLRDNCLLIHDLLPHNGGQLLRFLCDCLLGRFLDVRPCLSTRVVAGEGIGEGGREGKQGNGKDATHSGGEEVNCRGGG